MRDFGLPPATDNTQRRQDVVIELLSDILDELRGGAVPGVNAAAVIPGVTPETTDLTEPRRQPRKRSNG